MRDNLLQIEWIETMAAHVIAKKYLSVSYYKSLDAEFNKLYAWF